MSIKLGITGGIGSGKTVVSRLLEVMGVPMYIADFHAKRLIQSDLFIRDSLVSLLGTDVYLGGMLNKKMLARYIFDDTKNLSKVNAIIHPVVKADFEKWIKAHNRFKFVGIEAAILIEAGFVESVDKVVLVYAPFETRIRRAMLRDSSSREEVLSRIKNQISDDEKQQYADFVIRNAPPEPLLPQVSLLLTELL